MCRPLKRRKMAGIPHIIAGIKFGSVDETYGAPLHRRLGIETFVHLQAVLFDPQAQGFGQGRNWAGTDQHWYRYPITLARIA